MAQALTDQNFTSATASGVVLVDFWAPWCGPCRVQGPIVEDLAEQYKGKEGVTIAKLNVDENPATSQAHGIMSIPTLMIFKNGKLVDQMIGLQNKQAIVEHLERQLA